MPVYFGHPPTNITGTYTSTTYNVSSNFGYTYTGAGSATIVNPKTYMPDIEGKGIVLSINREGTVVFEPIGEWPAVSVPFEARNSHFRHPSMMYGEDNKKLEFPRIGDIIDYWCHSYSNYPTFCYETWEKQKPMRQLSLFEEV